MFGKVMKQELRANSLLYGVASAIALLFAFATVINRTRGTDVSYLVKAPLLISGCTIAIVVLVILFLIHTASVDNVDNPVYNLYLQQNRAFFVWITYFSTFSDF